MFHDGLINQRKLTVLKVRAKYLRALRLEMESFGKCVQNLKGFASGFVHLQNFLRINRQ